MSPLLQLVWRSWEQPILFFGQLAFIFKSTHRQIQNSGKETGKGERRRGGGNCVSQSVASGNPQANVCGCSRHCGPSSYLLLFFYIVNCLLCMSYRWFLLYPRPTVHFYMFICRILPIQPLGWHIEINACLAHLKTVMCCNTLCNEIYLYSSVGPLCFNTFE